MNQICMNADGTRPLQTANDGLQKWRFFAIFREPHCVRDAGAGGSNPLTPTSFSATFPYAYTVPAGTTEPPEAQ